MREKRYQVFVSSTFEDLQAERQEVMHALLELDAIPAGMELFVATTEDQWSLIKRVIDDSDYYIVIVGGRYGSVDASGMSFTEKEFRYASQIKKPLLGFLHKDPSLISAGKTEKMEEGKRRLDEFRKLVQSERIVKYWSSAAEIGSVVSRSVINEIKRNPAVGWVRADQIAGEEASQEILRLRHRVDELEGVIRKARTEAPPGTESLAQGDDVLAVHFDFFAHDPNDVLEDSVGYSAEWDISWNDLFAWISPVLVAEASEEAIRDMIGYNLRRIHIAKHGRKQEFKDKELVQFKVELSDFQTMIVQFQALGLITQGTNRRSAKDISTYWTLTPYGTHLMTNLRAIRRPS